MTFTILCMIALVALTTPCLAYAEAEAKSEEESPHIVILATSDLHANILGYSYEDNKETTNNGMARLYTYIKEVREKEPAVYLIDAGDDIQGSIMTDDIANKNPDHEHPVIAAMNYIVSSSLEFH